MVISISKVPKGVSSYNRPGVSGGNCQLVRDTIEFYVASTTGQHKTSQSCRSEFNDRIRGVQKLGL